MFVSRLTVDLQRPVPVHTETPLTVSTRVLRSGRRVQRIGASLHLGDRVLCEAIGVRLRISDLDLKVSQPQPIFPPPEACEAFEFPFFRHSVGYHKAVELRIASGVFGEGAMAAWIRPRLPLIEGEATSPLEQLVIVADAAHGVGVQLDTAKWTFVNPDLSLHLHRLPEVLDWVCLSARTRSEQTGIGLCTTDAFDQIGPLGQILQSQVIEAT